MDNATHNRLRDIFRSVFRLPPETDVRGLRQDGAQQWDSLAHVMLVAAMENEFGIRIELGEALGITSFETATALLRAKQGAVAAP